MIGRRRHSEISNPRKAAKAAAKAAELEAAVGSLFSSAFWP